MRLYCIILLFFILPVYSTSFSQNNSEQQTYIYSNKNIKIEVTANKFLFKKSDVINCTLTIENLSNDTILVFPNIQHSLNGDILTFELGGEYLSDISFIDSMKIIPDREKNIYKISIPAKELRTTQKNKFVRVCLSLGYIPNINKFKNLKKYKEFWRKDDFYYTGSAEIFVKLERLNINSFGFEEKE